MLTWARPPDSSERRGPGGAGGSPQRLKLGMERLGYGNKTYCILFTPQRILGYSWYLLYDSVMKGLGIVGSPFSRWSPATFRVTLHIVTPPIVAYRHMLRRAIPGRALRWSHLDRRS